MTISAKVIQDSSYKGNRVITFELEYPRFIHSEFMTHRLFSRNSASSRAIPIEKMNETVMNNPAAPIHWGKNQPGMQAKEQLAPAQLFLAMAKWENAKRDAVMHSYEMHKLGTHKQIANRLTEPFQHMKVVMTTTELANWFWLRDHSDAQPEIRELAIQMVKAIEASKPMELRQDEWHVPYVTRQRAANHDLVYLVNGVEVDVETAKKVSASCCAQVSYRKADDSLEKADKIFTQLIESEPCHASPVEHQATPIKERVDSYIFDHRVVPNLNVWYYTESWENGITHVDKNTKFWSGNFRGWIQFRQLIPNNTKW